MKIKISEQTKTLVKTKAKWLATKWQFWAAVGGFYCISSICGAVSSTFQSVNPTVMIQETKVEETKEVFSTDTTAETVEETAEDIVSETIIAEEELQVVESESEIAEIDLESKAVDAATVVLSPVESKSEEVIVSESKASVTEASATYYILNTNPERLKIHISGSGQCIYVKKIAAEHYKESTLSLEELQAQGYTLCTKCH